MPGWEPNPHGPKRGGFYRRGAKAANTRAFGKDGAQTSRAVSPIPISAVT